MVGNPHSTLIGLVGSSWLTASGAHWLLDGPPTAGRGRVADLILGVAQAPCVAVEIEGTAYFDKLDTLGLYLGSSHADLAEIQLALLICYAYPPERPALPIEDLSDKARQLGLAHPGKWIAVVFLEKDVGSADASVMNRNAYYRYRFNRASCIVSRNGSAYPEPHLIWESDMKSDD